MYRYSSSRLGKDSTKLPAFLPAPTWRGCRTFGSFLDCCLMGRSWDARETLMSTHECLMGRLWDVHETPMSHGRPMGIPWASHETCP